MIEEKLVCIYDVCKHDLKPNAFFFRVTFEKCEIKNKSIYCTTDEPDKVDLCESCYREIVSNILNPEH